MRPPRRARFWAELALAAMSALCLALTIAIPDWIERIFHVSPDAGSGLTEALIGAATVAVVGAALFFRRLRRVRLSKPNRDAKG